MKTLQNIRTSHIAIAIIALCLLLGAPHSTGADETEDHHVDAVPTAATAKSARSNEELNRQESAGVLELRNAQREKLVKEGKVALGEGARKRVTNLIINVNGRMMAAVNRLLNIAERLGARATIMAEGGADVNAEVITITNTTDALNRAKAQLRDIESAITSIAYAENPKEAFSSLKGDMAALKKSIQQSHQELRFVLATLTRIENSNTETPASDTSE